MRHGIIVFILLITSVLAAETISTTIHFDAPEIIAHRGETLVTFDNTMQSGLPGEPSIPYRSLRLMLPPSSTVADITILRENPVELDGSWSLFPTQHVRPISQGSSGDFVRDNDVYTSSSAYPANFHGEVRVDHFRGYSYAMVSVTPVEYIPARGSIRYYSTIRVEIQTKSDFSPKILSVSSRESVRNMARRIADNPEMASRYNTTQNRAGTYEMLIVTSDDFMEGFGPLMQLYREKGMRCEIVSIDEATGTQTGQDDQEKLRNYIIQEYTEHDIQYVLLGGDVDIIQYRGFFCQVQSSELYESDDIPSDLYYSSLDGTWNDDNDNLWGEIGEDDLLPDVAVGRMPFDEQDEFDAMMHKILMYQTEPVEDELNNPLLVGENMSEDPMTWGGDLMDTIVGEENIAGYYTNGIPETDPYETLYDRDQGEWGSYQLIDEINEGHPYIHHAGHSNSNYNMRMMIFQITDGNFGGVNGTDHNYTNVYSHGCISAAFDEEDCIGERMVLIENFAASYLGNTRYGWFNEGQLEGPSQHLHREYVDALYSDGIRQIGMAHLESRIMTAPFVNAPGQHEQGALRWCFYDCTVLGDPAMSIWCDSPRDVTARFDEPLPVGSTSMQVEIEGDVTEGVVCTLVQDDILLGSAATDANGTASIHFDAAIADDGDTKLYVSGNDILNQEYDVEVSEVQAPWIVLRNVASGDSPEYGETVALGVTLKNVGQTASSVVGATLQTEDEYIELAGQNPDIQAIAPGDSAVVENAFSLEATGGVPDRHEALLQIVFEDHPEWTAPFTITFNAPQLAFLNWEINYPTTDRSGMLHPGEPGFLSVAIENRGHAASQDVSVSLSLESGDVEIEDQETTFDPVESCGMVVAHFILTPDEEMEIGSIASFRMTVDSGSYGFEYVLDIPVGELWENFNDFSALPWAFTGEAEWGIADDGYYSDTCARSGDIEDNETSGITISMENLYPGLISFFYKVSSEADGDKLRFFIDDMQMGMWSGDIDWRERVCPVEGGDHTFTWLYTKDGGASEGDDCAWIDRIIFPSHVSTNSTDPEEVARLVSQGLTNYPNPFNPETTFAFALEEPSHVSLEVYNIRGQKVRRLLDESMQTGVHRAVWHGKDDTGRAVSSGVYFARITTKNGTVVKKVAMVK